MLSLRDNLVEFERQPCAAGLAALQVGKKISMARGGRHNRQSVRLFNPRMSVQSTSPSPSSSSSAVNLAAMVTTLSANTAASAGQHREETIPEEGKLSPVVAPEPEEEMADTAYSKSELLCFLWVFFVVVVFLVWFCLVQWKPFETIWFGTVKIT